MQVELIIRYKHDMTPEKEHVCTGSMFYRSLDGSFPPFRQWEFEKQHFKKLLVEASNRLNKDTEVSIERLLIERTDRPGLQPVLMDHPTVEILKTDPVVAIRLLTYEGRTMRGERKADYTPPPPMVSGYDTMAETIGEEIYCRQHKGMVECPGCGMYTIAPADSFTCRKKCRIHNVPVNFTEQWARFSVPQLLAINLEKYFIPRGFNPTKPWITWEALNHLYMTWKQVGNQQETGT